MLGSIVHSNLYRYLSTMMKMMTKMIKVFPDSILSTYTVYLSINVNNFFTVYIQ